MVTVYSIFRSASTLLLFWTTINRIAQKWSKVNPARVVCG